MIRTIVPMFNLKTGNIDFEVIVYNRSVKELSLIPNEVIAGIARRFPDHTSTPFALQEIGERKTTRVKQNKKEVQYNSFLNLY